MELEDSKKNILIINDYGIQGSGGTENRIKTLIAELKKRKYFNSIHVLHPEKHVQPALEGVFFHPLKNDNKYLTYKTTLNIIEKHKIDIVQAHNLMAIYPVVMLAAKAKKIPIVWFVHDFWALCGLRTLINACDTQNNSLCEKTSFFKCVKCLGLKGYIRQRISTYLMGLTDVAVLPGKFIEKIFNENNFLTQKMKIVFPWIRYEPTIELDSSIKKENYTILFVGALVEYKGAWQPVKALKYILKSFPEAELKIIGTDQEKESPFRKNIEELAVKEGVLDKIHFLGYMTKDELMKEYQKSTVLVFSSDWVEIFGQVWAEALFFGSPVVASNLGGPSEFLNNFGILYPAKDYIKLAEAVKEIFADKEIYFNKAREGRKFVAENFNINRAADNMIKIYKELIKIK